LDVILALDLRAQAEAEARVKIKEDVYASLQVRKGG
jgi:hypothetical protein